MYRKGLINMLLDTPMGVEEIARTLGVAPKEVEEDLHHLQRSLRRSDYKFVIHPAECRKCGFKFNKEKLHKPGKCPRCHESWIREPLIEVVERKH